MMAGGPTAGRLVPRPSTASTAPMSPSPFTVTELRPACGLEDIVVPCPPMAAVHRALAFAMATHPRLGCRAPAAMARLPPALCRRIFDFLGAPAVTVDIVELQCQMIAKGKSLRLRGVRDRVTRVHHRPTGVQFALKSVADSSTAAQDRRLRLALLASYRIPGTCIIPCFGSVCVDNSVALVLAHASAGSLQDVLDRAGPAGLPEPVAAAVMLQVFTGLLEMERSGCNMDAYTLRPSCILVHGTGAVHLSGFEAYVSQGQEASSHHHQGVGVGVGAAGLGPRPRPRPSCLRRALTVMLSCLTGVMVTVEALEAIQGKRWHTTRMSAPAADWVRVMLKCPGFAATGPVTGLTQCSGGSGCSGMPMSLARAMQLARPWMVGAGVGSLDAARAVLHDYLPRMK